MMAADPPAVNPRDLDDVEHWYELLRDVTFRSAFIPLTLEQAQAINNAYTALKAQRSNVLEAKIDPKDQTTLEQLAQEIQKTIDEFGCKEVFCRLSTRSPKDYALRAPKAMQLLKDELAALGAGPDDEILQVIAIIRTASKCLKVSSGAEAVEFQINSERSYQDLTRRILDCDGAKFSMNLIIREWEDIKPEFEFRGFVHEGQLTGLTQYYKACFVPELAQNAEKIEKDLIEFWNSVAPKVASIGLKSYVIDLAWTPERVWFVELNQFGPTASPSLFDWKQDHDVLHNGPFQFRIVKNAYPNAKALIARPLRAMMAQIYPSWAVDTTAPTTAPAAAQTDASGEAGSSNSKCIIS